MSEFNRRVRFRQPLAPGAGQKVWFTWDAPSGQNPPDQPTFGVLNIVAARTPTQDGGARPLSFDVIEENIANNEGMLIDIPVFDRDGGKFKITPPGALMHDGVPGSAPVFKIVFEAGLTAIYLTTQGARQSAPGGAGWPFVRADALGDPPNWSTSALAARVFYLTTAERDEELAAGPDWLDVWCAVSDAGTQSALLTASADAASFERRVSIRTRYDARIAPGSVAILDGQRYIVSTVDEIGDRRRDLVCELTADA